MGSTAARTSHLPGLAQQVELAYLAGLLDRAGGFNAAKPNTIGLRLTVDDELGEWLLLRFGGTLSGRTWWLTRQADLAVVLAGVEPFLVARRARCAALRALVAHLRARTSYHGTPEWRERRSQLMRAV